MKLIKLKSSKLRDSIATSESSNGFNFFASDRLKIFRQGGNLYNIGCSFWWDDGPGLIPFRRGLGENMAKRLKC